MRQGDPSCLALSASNSFSNLPLLHDRNHDATGHDRQRIDETRQQHRQGWKFRPTRCDQMIAQEHRRAQYEADHSAYSGEVDR